MLDYESNKMLSLPMFHKIKLFEVRDVVSSYKLDLSTVHRFHESGLAFSRSWGMPQLLTRQRDT